MMRSGLDLSVAKILQQLGIRASIHSVCIRRKAANLLSCVLDRQHSLRTIAQKARSSAEAARQKKRHIRLLEWISDAPCSYFAMHKPRTYDLGAGTASEDSRRTVNATQSRLVTTCEKNKS